MNRSESEDNKVLCEILSGVDLAISRNEFNLAREILLQLDRSYYTNPLVRERIARLNDELKRETSKYKGDSLKSQVLSILEEFKSGLEREQS